MDEVEKKLREHYQARKNEDEKAIPDFDTIMNRDRPLMHPVKWHLSAVLRIAACILGVLLALSYYFFDRTPPLKQTTEIRSISLHSSFPSESLFKGKLGNEYLWQWKSSTDQLVEDARQLTKSKTQTNKGI